MKFSSYNHIIDLADSQYLLCNTLSGNMYSIDSRMKDIIQKEDTKILSEDESNELVKNGIMIEDDIDELKLLNYANKLDTFANKILNITLLLTSACNLKCTYCFQGAGDRPQDSLSDTTRAGIFNFIKHNIESKKLQGVSIVLFGGEPTMYLGANMPFLRDVQNYCKQLDIGFYTSIITNGVLLTEINMSYLKELNCQMIQITLDGTKEIHDSRRMYKSGKGSFDNVIAGIKTTANNSDLPKPVIRINIDKDNYEKTFILIDYLAEIGLTQYPIDFGIVKADSKSNENYADKCFSEDELGNILERLWIKLQEKSFNIVVQPIRRNSFCGLYSDNAYTIYPSGDVYKCWELTEEKHRIGTINSEGELINQQFFYADWMARFPAETLECRKCKFLPMCGGGCGAVSYAKYGTYHEAGCFKAHHVFEKQLLWQYEKLKSQTTSNEDNSYGTQPC